MVFGGIQKLTLLDYPDKTACTIFTVGCNFDCKYCQNSSLINQSDSKDYIDETEILGFLKTRQNLLDGVCISGGEPLMQDDLDTFIDKLKALGFLIKLDTNGSYPDKLEKLIVSGRVDHVAMDIKNSPEKYAMTIGVPDYDLTPIIKSMEILRSSQVSYEFRTTVVRELHTVEDLISIAQWIFDAKKFYLQTFVDSEGVSQRGLHSYSDSEMLRFLSNIIDILPNAELRGM